MATMANDTKKYNSLEPVLNFINKNFISLKDVEIKQNNQILQYLIGYFLMKKPTAEPSYDLTFKPKTWPTVKLKFKNNMKALFLLKILNQIIEKMKEQDKLFKRLYQRVFYGGSFYDGLRVGKPSEFDLDLLLKLPIYAEPTITTSNKPGFVHLQMKNFDAFMKQPEAQAYYQNFGKLFDKNYYLDTMKVLAWMEGILQKALNQFDTLDANVKLIKQGGERFHVRFSKGGPALTLHVENPNNRSFNIDIDLVTCFIFGNDKWPANGFKPNPIPNQKPEFFIVPKKPKCNSNERIERYWRLSFQEQERILIDRKRTLKPTIKLLKKMRDTLNQPQIASYYIKTAVLLISDKKNDDFWSKPLSYAFMTIFKEYQEMIASRKIPYYWNKNNNLLGNINENILLPIGIRLMKVIKDVDDHLDDPKTIWIQLNNSDLIENIEAEYVNFYTRRS